MGKLKTTNTFKVLFAAVLFTQVCQAQVMCRTSVQNAQTQENQELSANNQQQEVQELLHPQPVKVGKKTISSQQAALWAQEFIDNKAIFGTLQLFCLRMSTNSESVKPLLKFGLNPSNKADQEFVDQVVQKSFQEMEQRLQILGATAPKRASEFSYIRNTFHHGDSAAQLEAALTYIAVMKELEPEKYEAFRSVWRETLPISIRLMAKMKAPGLTTPSALFDLFSAPIGAAYLANLLVPGMMDGIPVVMTGIAAFGLQYYAILTTEKNTTSRYIRKLISLPAYVMAGFQKSKVQKLMEKHLLLSAKDAQTQIASQDQRGLTSLDRVQHLDLGEVEGLLATSFTAELKTDSDYLQFQLLRMRKMEGIGGELSLIQERAQSLSKQIQDLIEKAKSPQKLSSAEKLKSSQLILILQKEASELYTDSVSVAGLNHKYQEQLSGYSQSPSMQQPSSNSPMASMTTNNLASEMAVVGGVEQRLQVLQRELMMQTRSLADLHLALMASQVIGK